MADPKTILTNKITDEDFKKMFTAVLDRKTTDISGNPFFHGDAINSYDPTDVKRWYNLIEGPRSLQSYAAFHYYIEAMEHPGAEPDPQKIRGILDGSEPLQSLGDISYGYISGVLDVLESAAKVSERNPQSDAFLARAGIAERHVDEAFEECKDAGGELSPNLRSCLPSEETAKGRGK